MNNRELKCPRCGETFTIDESSYNQIVSQIRTQEFKSELEQAKKIIILEKDEERIKQENLLKIDIQTLKQELETSKKLNDSSIEAIKNKFSLDANEIKEKLKNEYETIIVELKEKLSKLSSQLETDKQLTDSKIKIAIQEKEKEIIELQSKIKEKDSSIVQIKESSNRALQLLEEAKDKQIEEIKNFKSKLSTKMIGENLEVWAKDQFNQMRPYGFPNAYFEKDNTAVDSTKGDFIYRDFTENGNEFISALLEMKNESPDSNTKQKNDQFYEKLNLDRIKKNCEFAILVTNLEPESELYNKGIVDMSWKYPKTFACRPEMFVTLLGILKKVSMTHMSIVDELQAKKDEEVDLTNFENKLDDFQKKFTYHANQANTNFEKTIKKIDIAIDSLQNAKDILKNTGKYLSSANDDVGGITIRKLIYNNPTVKRLLTEARINNGKEAIEVDEE